MNRSRISCLFEREKLPESDKNRMTMSLRIDQNIPMGKVDDVKQALEACQSIDHQLLGQEGIQGTGKTKVT